MVWSKEDFVREVRRQLIELESLRKKIESEADVLECLERLERSQLRLLKKLNDYFESRPDEAPKMPKEIPEGIKAYLQVILQDGNLLDQLARQLGGGQGAAVLILGLGPKTGSSGFPPAPPFPPGPPFGIPLPLSPKNSASLDENPPDEDFLIEEMTLEELAPGEFNLANFKLAEFSLGEQGLDEMDLGDDGVDGSPPHPFPRQLDGFGGGQLPPYSLN